MLLSRWLCWLSVFGCILALSTGALVQAQDDSEIPIGEEIIPGTSVVGAIENPGGTRYYSFFASAGQGAIISMWRGGSGALDPYLILYAPDGTTLAEDDDGAGDGLSAYMQLALPQEGTYTIAATGADSSTGPFGLALEFFTPTTPEPETGDQPAGAPITPGLSVVGEIVSPGEMQYYTFSAQAEQPTIISMWRGGSGTIDPFVVLYDPDGEILAADDDGAGDGLSAYLQIALPQAGTYTIGATGADGSIGAYGLLLELPGAADAEPVPPDEDEPAPPDEDEPAPARNIGPIDSAEPLSPDVPVVGVIDSPGAQEAYSFVGGAGQVITASMWRGGNSPLDPYLILARPDGTVLTEDDNGSGDGVTAYMQYELPIDGTYILVATGTNDTTGPYGLVFSFNP